MAFATGTPNDAGASDGPFNSRVLLVSGAVQGMAAANSPQGSVTNRSAQSAASATAGNASNSVRGWNIYDSAAGGTRLMYGTMTAAFVASSVSGIALSAGRLNISIT
jgi:hypothetical protein